MSRKSRARVFVAAMIGLAMLPAISSAGGAQPDGEPSSFRQVVMFHLERYPAMEIEDLYKLAFQAAMGNEHAAPSREMAKQWLEHELATLGAMSGGVLIEPLSAGGSLVRVNLRAVIDQGADTAELLDAFLRTAVEFEGSHEKLSEYWKTVEAMAAAREIPFEKERIQGMWKKMESAGFPALRHSKTYRDLYQPAYRVVLVEFLRPGAAGDTSQ